MRNFCKTFVSAVLAGICISIGGIVFLSLDNRIAGAALFTVGLFVICTFKMNLFTGKVCYTLQNKPEYLPRLLIIWLGNLTGTGLMAFLVSLTRIRTISEKAAALCEVKVNDSLLSLFILGFICNMLIFIAVQGYNRNPHELGKYLSLFFGVMLFILCGTEHCVADMFYFWMSGAWSSRAVISLLTITFGNAAGGIILCQACKFIEIKPAAVSQTDSMTGSAG